MILVADDFVRLTTVSLIEGLLDRSSPQWVRFVRTFGPLVIVWIQKAGIPNSDVEDLAQEVFAAASAGIDTYRHSSGVDGSFRRWLWGTTRNRTLRCFSTLVNTPRASGGSTADRLIRELPDSPFEEESVQSVRQVRLDVAIRAVQVMKTDFEERTWQAFWQTAIDARPTREVAESLEMSKNQVRQSRSRVLRRLRAEFGEDVSILQE